VGRYTTVDHPTVKFTKVLIFVFMLTHVVTDLKNLNRLVWVLVIGGLILGMQAWGTPRRAFQSGRLEGIGGPDFSECNFLAAFLVSVLWLIGVQFLRSGWKGKVLCFLAGGFAANAVVLTRSRSALVGLAAGGLVALFAVPKRYRGYLAVGLVVAAAGFYYLTDEQFLARAATVMHSEEERDSSAQSRIVLAQAGFRMWRDHPLGVGPGNFYQNIGRYVPEYAGKDAHNTYVRCLTELGAIGIAVYLGLLVNAAWVLRRAMRQAARLPASLEGQVTLLCFGMMCSLAAMAGCFLTISLTYVEFTWWFLMLPVCMERTVYNLLADAHGVPSPAAAPVLRSQPLPWTVPGGSRSPAPNPWGSA
jgi:hypothetical protein